MTITKPPSFLQRAAIALNVFRSGYPRAVKQAPFLWPAMRQGIPQWQITDFASYITDGFQRNSLIYEAIMYKVRSTWYTPLRAYAGDVDHPEVLPLNHPLAALVHRPNSYQSTAQFMGSNTVYLNIAGNSYVLLDRPKVGALPTAMYPLRPDRVWIVPGDRGIKGYLYVPENRSPRDGVPILPEDMIHVRLPNPGDPLEGMGYGLSPFAAMSRSADVDNGVTEYLKIFFQKGTAPNVYLKFDVPMDDATISQVKHRFQEIYGGYEKWADVGVVDQGGSIESFGSSFKEMAFPALDYRNESRITGPFGVPLTVLNTLAGMSGATYSNKETDRRIFWEDTMIPELGLHEADYQLSLVGADGAFVAFDTRQIPALKKDKAALASAFVALFSQGGWTKNQAASYLDMDAGEFMDGDTVYMPLNLIPMSSKPAAPAPANAESATQAAPETQPEGKARRNGQTKIDDLISEAKDLAIAALTPQAPVINVYNQPPAQPAPIVNVYNEVQPTPVQIDATPINNSVTVNPTPINVEAAAVNVSVEPTPVNVTVSPSTVENVNAITVQPQAAQVEVVPMPPHTEITEIERDAQGNMTRTIKKVQ